MADIHSETPATKTSPSPTPRSVRVFVVLVDACAALLLMGLLLGAAPQRILPLVALGVVGLLAGVASVNLPKHRTFLVPTEPFILAGLCLVGPWAAVVVAVAPVVSRALFGKTRAVQVAFNLGASVVAAGAAALAFSLAGGLPGANPILQVFPVFAAAAAFFLVNSVLVTGVVAVSQKRSVLQTLKEVFLGTVPAHAAGPLLALALLMVVQAGLVWMLAASVAAFAVTVVLFRAHASRVHSAPVA